jgi:SET family sugar efflux transporter-like MFS transporter
MFLLAFSFTIHPISIRFHKDLRMLVDDDGATPERRVCRFYAGGLYDGRGGALQAPTLSLFLSREVGRSRSGLACFTPSTPLPGSWSASRWRNDRTARAIAAADPVLLRHGRGQRAAVCLQSSSDADYLRRAAGVAGEYRHAAAVRAGREYADSSAREVVMFSSVMRAQLSLAWVIGPPLAFMLALNYGFTTMFSIAAGIFVISLALIAFALPSVARVEQTTDKPSPR